MSPVSGCPPHLRRNYLGPITRGWFLRATLSETSQTATREQLATDASVLQAIHQAETQQVTLQSLRQHHRRLPFRVTGMGLVCSLRRRRPLLLRSTVAPSSAWSGTASYA